MTRRLLGLGLILILCLSARAYAGFYAFSIGGEVTSSSHLDVSVGDPFTVRYVIDSEDRDPRPNVGSYQGTPATATFPNAVIVSHGPFTPGMAVELNVVGSGIDSVGYGHSALNFYRYEIGFHFPTGTLASDALPLSLPLAKATQAVFGISDGFLILGQVTSYDSGEVPEPGASVMLLSLIMLLARQPLAPLVRRRL